MTESNDILPQVLLFAFVCAASGRVFLIDDGDYEGNVGHIQSLSNSLEERRRVRRDSKILYTFVKTDPQANFKWGVRHRAGAQYGR